MATRQFADLSSYRKAVNNAQATGNLLDTILGGIQQGVKLQQLPQTIQDNQLAQQLQNAINLEKLNALQNPEQALARQIERELTVKAALNPSLGITRAPVGLAGETIFNPGVVGSAPRLPENPVSAFGIETGLNLNPNIPLEAETRKTDEMIRRLQATPVRQTLTKEGYAFNPVTGQLEEPLIPGQVALPEQLRTQREAEAAAKGQVSKDIAESRNASQKERQEDQQSFVAEQNEKNRMNRLSLADKRAKIAGGAEISPYQVERQTRILDSVDDLEKDVGYDTVGFADWFKGVPTSAAREFAGKLKTLKGAIAFGELTAMREASKTGGALGQVSNLELGLLESALGNLDQAQSPSEFKGELQKVRDSIKRWRDASSKAPQGSIGNAAPNIKSIKRVN